MASKVAVPVRESPHLITVAAQISRQVLWRFPRNHPRRRSHSQDAAGGHSRCNLIIGAAVYTTLPYMMCDELLDYAHLCVLVLSLLVRMNSCPAGSFCIGPLSCTTWLPHHASRKLRSCWIASRERSLPVLRHLQYYTHSAECEYICAFG